MQRAAYENTSIFGLMRDKGMLKEGKPAFFDYLFKDRDVPLTFAEGEAVHREKESGT